MSLVRPKSLPLTVCDEIRYFTLSRSLETVCTIKGDSGLSKSTFKNLNVSMFTCTLKTIKFTVLGFLGFLVIRVKSFKFLGFYCNCYYFVMLVKVPKTRQIANRRRPAWPLH